MRSFYSRMPHQFKLWSCHSSHANQFILEAYAHLLSRSVSIFLLLPSTHHHDEVQRAWQLSHPFEETTQAESVPGLLET